MRCECVLSLQFHEGLRRAIHVVVLAGLRERSARFGHGRRIELVALLVLSSLALTGLVTPTEALAGFSNPAVITVWAMFILSAGLTRTGVAELIGNRILRWVGPGEVRMIAAIMLVSGVLSAFMNNIGVAALMLPVAIYILLMLAILNSAARSASSRVARLRNSALLNTAGAPALSA